MLQYLGDVGGLIDALWLIGKFLMIPYAKYSLDSLLLQDLFRMQSARSEAEPVSDGQPSINDNHLVVEEEEEEACPPPDSVRAEGFVRQFTRKSGKSSISFKDISTHIKRSFAETKVFPKPSFVAYLLGFILIFCRCKMEAKGTA